MGRMRFVPVVLAALLLAGCAGQGRPSSAGVTDLPGGVIAGVVLDDVGLPVEGAEIAVLDMDNRSVLSGADGRFRLVGVPPGRHELAAAKLGFESVRRPVQVSEDSVLELEVQLVPIVTPDAARREIFPGRGFLSCNASSYVLTPTLTQICGWDANNEPTFSFEVNVAEGLVAVVTELAWTPTTGVTAQELRLGLWKNGGCGTRCNHDFVYEPYVTGPSPLRKVMGNVSDPFKLELHRNEPTRLTAVALVADGALTRVEVVWQQAVEFYASVFYNEDAPTGYSAVPT